MSELHSVELDFADRLIRPRRRFFERCGAGGHTQYAPGGRLYISIVVKLRSGMEDHDAVQALRLVNPGDRFAGGVISRITGRSHHHAGRRLFTPELPTRLRGRQPYLSHGQSHFGEITVESPTER